MPYELSDEEKSKGWTYDKSKNTLYPPASDKDRLKGSMSDAAHRKEYNRQLIDSSFPSQGILKPSYEGSQSNPPNKENP